MRRQDQRLAFMKAERREGTDSTSHECAFDSMNWIIGENAANDSDASGRMYFPRKGANTPGTTLPNPGFLSPILVLVHPLRRIPILGVEREVRDVGIPHARRFLDIGTASLRLNGRSGKAAARLLFGLYPHISVESFQLCSTLFPLHQSKNALDTSLLLRLPMRNGSKGKFEKDIHSQMLIVDSLSWMRGVRLSSPSNRSTGDECRWLAR